MDPIIYVHKGSHKYLQISIRQALKNNKKIILIGDAKNLDIAKKYNIEHYYFDKFNNSDFKKYYKHNKPNTNYNFELMCYERWFVIYEVMGKYKINRCLYLDSDILYYGNVDEEFKRIEKYGNYELAYPNFSGHTTYIFSQNSLKNFCDFMMKCYKDKDMYERLLNRPLIYQPGISDMSIFQLYKFYYSNNVFDLTKDYGDKIVYDGFINFSEGYKTLFGKKYFTIENNKIFVYINKERYEIKTLHFQMHMKKFMGLVFYKQIRSFRILMIFNYFIERSYFKFSFIRHLRRKFKDGSLFK